jgi:hypothetical protein
MGSVTAINTFSLRPGVARAEFEAFSRTQDRPNCLAFDVVQSFEVFVSKEDNSRVDIVELMTVTSWDEWVAVLDTAPALKSVVARFEELVDVESVYTVLTRRASDVED